jgi:hypothetical protein
LAHENYRPVIDIYLISFEGPTKKTVAVKFLTSRGRRWLLCDFGAEMPKVDHDYATSIINLRKFDDPFQYNVKKMGSKLLGGLEIRDSGEVAERLLFTAGNMSVFTALHTAVVWRGLIRKLLLWWVYGNVSLKEERWHSSATSPLPAENL